MGRPVPSLLGGPPVSKKCRFSKLSCTAQPRCSSQCIHNKKQCSQQSLCHSRLYLYTALYITISWLGRFRSLVGCEQKMPTCHTSKVHAGCGSSVRAKGYSRHALAPKGTVTRQFLYTVNKIAAACACLWTGGAESRVKLTSPVKSRGRWFTYSWMCATIWSAITLQYRHLPALP